MFISFFTGKVMLFYGISLIMKEKSNASALNLAPATSESAPCDVRVCSQRRLHTGRYSPKVIVLASGGKVEIG